MYKKKLVHNKWTILGPKMEYPHNCGSALRISLKFCRVKGVSRYMKILWVDIREKSSFGLIWSFYPSGHFFLFDCAWSNWARPPLIGSFNNQDLISFMITAGSLNSTWLGFLNREDMISQVNIYVVDIVCRLYDIYMWRSKFMLL